MDLRERFLQVLESVQSRRKPMLRLALRRAEGWDDVLASKILGMPYWEDGMPEPMDDDGRPLQMIAQLNLALMPQLPRFPAQGLLQFFIADNDEYGSPRNGEVDHASNRVIYWPMPDIARQAPYPVMKMEFCPADAPLLIEPGEISMEDCGLHDYESADIYAGISQTQFPDLDWGAFHVFREEHVDNCGCKLGGFAYFTQDDPRHGRDFGTAREWIQLLQLDCDHEAMMWGDAGVAHWFIRREDLERRDFSRVFYHWDCC